MLYLESVTLLELWFQPHKPRFQAPSSWKLRSWTSGPSKRVPLPASVSCTGVGLEWPSLLQLCQAVEGAVQSSVLK